MRRRSSWQRTWISGRWPGWPAAQSLPTSLACSAETQGRIDELVVELLRSQHDKAVGILEENKEKLHELARFLYEKETITGDEFMEILNK